MSQKIGLGEIRPKPSFLANQVEFLPRSLEIHSCAMCTCMCGWLLAGVCCGCGGVWGVLLAGWSGTGTSQIRQYQTVPRYRCTGTPASRQPVGGTKDCSREHQRRTTGSSSSSTRHKKASDAVGCMCRAKTCMWGVGWSGTAHEHQKDHWKQHKNACRATDAGAGRSLAS